MTAADVTRWALLAASLFNAMLLFWLGWMVVLNAERRAWAVWLIGAALITGGLFFAGHAGLADAGIRRLAFAIENWWPAGWAPGIALPFAWYLVMLWHGGCWEKGSDALRARHRPLLLVTAGAGALLAATLGFALPFPAFVAFRAPASALPAALAPAYPLFILWCIALSLDVVRRPGPPSRVMGDLARRRARPWLMATGLVLLAVSLLVGGMMLRLARPEDSPGRFALSLAWGDLAITALIAVSILLLGQAMVAYEIFTGKTLPRRGLRRRWFNAVVLALSYSVLVGLAAVLHVPPVYHLLLVAFLGPLLYALFGWRSYVERERYMRHLRPFISGPRVYDALLAGAGGPPEESSITGPFHALCSDVLGARVAYLAAAGPLAPLAGAPLAHPEGTAPPAGLPEVVGRCGTPHQLCFALEPERHGGAVWAVPLWSGHGLAGVLLLGEKSDGGLYTEEEMEIARASGERLVDAQASTSLARRLMELQRRRLAEIQVLDQRARHVLHDEVLPRLHALLLDLAMPAEARPGGLEGAAPSDRAEPQAQLADVHRRVSDLLREMPAVRVPQVARLGLFGALRQAIEEEQAGSFDGVAWEIPPEAEAAAGALPPLAAEVVYYAAREAVRNAARHGRAGDGERPLRLKVSARCGEGIEITVADDGVGPAGGSPAAGAGQGLALHGTMMAVIGGALAVESGAAGGTRVVLTVREGR